MNGSGKILIVTDGDAATREIAKGIASVIVPPSFASCSVSIVEADAFDGTDILPARVFFLGCAMPSPPSFAFMETLLERINLAGRSCGIFSARADALNYLSGILRSSEVLVGKPLLVKDGKTDSANMREWVKNILEMEVGK